MSAQEPAAGAGPVLTHAHASSGSQLIEAAADADSARDFEWGEVDSTSSGFSFSDSDNDVLSKAVTADLIGVCPIITVDITPGPIRWYNIQKASFKIGSSLAADIQLPLPDIWPLHCRVDWRGGGLYINDLGTSDGICINGSRHGGDGFPSASVPITWRDEMTIGSVTIRFSHKFPDPAPAPDAAADPKVERRKEGRQQFVDDFVSGVYQRRLQQGDTGGRRRRRRRGRSSSSDSERGDGSRRHRERSRDEGRHREREREGRRSRSRSRSRGKDGGGRDRSRERGRDRSRGGREDEGRGAGRERERERDGGGRREDGHDGGSRARDYGRDAVRDRAGDGRGRSAERHSRP